MRRLLRLAAAAGLAAALGAAATASTSTASAAACAALDYQAGLRAAAAALQQAPPDAAGAQRTIRALLAADPQSAVALQPVAADLSAAPADVADAELRLASMSATLAYPRGSVCNENAAAARSALHDVYASPDLANLDRPVQQNPLTAILNAIGDLLSRGAGALGPVGGALLAAAVLSIAFALLWRRWRGSAALRGAAIAEEPATAGDDPDREWRAAEQAAARGDFREAVRRAFRSALVEVVIRGNVRIDAAWTTRELLGRTHASGDVLVALAAAAAIFERAWYSGLPVTGDDWSRARERCRAVRQLAGRAGVVTR